MIYGPRARGALLAGAAALCFSPPASAQTQTSGAIESSHTFCTAQCSIYGGQINTDGTGALWAMLLDAAAAPNAGAGTIAVTGCTSAAAARPCVLKWYQVGSNTTTQATNFMPFNGASRLPAKAGFVAACSSSSSPYTLVYTSHCVFSFETLFE